MQTRPQLAAILIIAGSLSTGLNAQTTYRCGNSYSQMPCTGAVVINASDVRSSAQKKQTDEATAQDAKTADSMERARLQKEQQDLSANTPQKKSNNFDNSNNNYLNRDAPPLQAKKPNTLPFKALAPGTRKIAKVTKKKIKQTN